MKEFEKEKAYEWINHQDDHRKLNQWNEHEVEKLLDSYAARSRSLKGSRLWEQVQKDLLSYGIDRSLWALEKKWNNILRSFRKENSVTQFPHFNRVQDIMERRQLDRAQSMYSGRSSVSKYTDTALDNVANAIRSVSSKQSSNSDDPEDKESRQIEQLTNAVRGIRESYRRENEGRNKIREKYSKEFKTITKR
jgi:uncharacterized protein (UPF0305 family)